MKDPDLIYVTARELPPQERPAYLVKACENDKALHARLEQMLAVADQADAFLFEPPDGESEDRNLARKRPQSGAMDLTDFPDEAIGQKIGRYKILERVGEGGCGVVYVAQQTEPVRRRVALKIIKLGMDTKQVVARFEAERQALALMGHPNIAKVLDGGSTDNGRPYFIMELVRGIKITDYCDQAGVATKERLELFIKVCQAIQHAHQKGVIHRDIKPSNILVTINDGVPVPKVIDFGIAKATEGRLTDVTIYTQLHQLIGTPAYMSPEQAEMSSLDVDTRSDIYSLGVLLYELLAGATPFDPQELMASGLDAMRKVIREKEPVRPSTRLATLPGDDLTSTARQRAIEAPKLVHLLKGDLDWIVMKCLEKDRTRRYETANGLAADIRRHLNGEPVLACPPSKLYEFRRMVRRHKVGFAATAAVLFALSAGLVISVWQAVRAGNAEHEQRILRAAAENARSDETAQRQAAQKAEAEQARQKIVALQSLYDSLLAQARATRLARRVGYRQEVFKLLEQARSLDVPHKNLTDLRREAVGCLGDFVGLSPIIFSNTPPIYDWSSAVDLSGKWAAFGLIQGGIQVCEAATGKVIASLGGSTRIFERLCFDSTGEQLWALFREPVLPAVGQAIWSWNRDAKGRFHENGKFALPGAVDFVQRGTEAFAAVIEVVSNKTGVIQSPKAKIRLFNVRSRNVASGYEVINALPAHYDLKIAHTPDGALLAVETVDTQNPTPSGQVTVYTWQTGQPVAHLDLQSAEASGILSLSPEGKYLAWATASGGAIWTLPDFKRAGEFKEYFDVPISLGKRMALVPVSQQARFRLWDPVRKEDITSIDGSGKLAFAPDESFLLAAGEYTAIYSLATPEKMVLPPHADAVTGAEFSPDGTRLASVSKDRVVRVCDAMTGRILWESNDLPGPGQCVGFSPDGQWLATGAGLSGAPCIRDAHTGKQLLNLGTNGTGKTWSAQFSRDGHYLASAGEDGTRIWTIQRDPSNEAAGGLKVKQVKARAVFSQNLLFSPDSRYVTLDDTWQSPTGFSLYLWDLSKPAPDLVAQDNSWGAQCASFTPDSRSLVMMGPNREIVTMDLASKKGTASIPTQNVQGSRNAVNNFVLSPDGSRLAFATTSMRGVDVWDMNKGVFLYSLPEEVGTVYWLAWSPDSHRLDVTRDNGQIGIWNLDVVDQIVTQLGLKPD